jgi:DNA polymerase-3 subunit delta'
VTVIGTDESGRLPLPWLDRPLKRALALDKAHALLVHGPAGVGQFEMGLLLAQAWLCEAAGTAADRPCGHCDACRLVRQRSHPDLMLVVPDALRLALGWVGDDDAQSRAESKAKPSQEIKVDQVRAAIGAAQRTTGRGRGKAVLLYPADAMNLVSANALLKTLEEPGGAMRLLLCTAHPDWLLPTVRSRCQALLIDLPADEVARHWLCAAEPSLDEGQASVLLAVAGGAPMAAQALLREGVDAARLAALPRRVAAGDAAVLAGLTLPRVVELLSKLAHDAMRRAVAADDDISRCFFPAGAVPFGAAMPALVKWHHALLRVARNADHPWNAGLLVEALVAEARLALAPPRSGRLPVTDQPLHSLR